MGKTLENLDISNCSLTDKSCSSIAHHCQAIEALGLRNVREITGAPLATLFTDDERCRNICAVTFSGSKKVKIVAIKMCVNVYLK